MNLKTSTKISIKFTLITVVIVFLFWVLVNIIFFQMRYWALKFDNGPEIPALKPWNHFGNINFNIPKNLNFKYQLWEKYKFDPINSGGIQNFKNKFIDNLSITINSEEHINLQKNTIYKQISKLWNSYFYHKVTGKKVTVKWITPQVQTQKNLLITSIYLLIFSAILSYILSIYFVKTSLRKLNDLVTYVKWLNLNNLEEKIEITWPENDEINILASKINFATDKINKQTLALKDFISNASHELKTPLMSISSQIDYSLKAKTYKEWMQNIKLEIMHLNDLLDELVLMSKLDSNIELKKTNENVSKITLSVLKMLEKKYKNKKIKVELQCKNIEKMIHSSSFEIIAKNLIENAFKYTLKWTIKIVLNEKEFIIQDSWIWINKKNLEKIWDRFWQEDASKTDITSFGLWLYLVKLLVKKHWWEIQVTSTKWKWTKFKIIW